METKRRKAYVPRPHVVVETEATVYRRGEDGRLIGVETLTVQWKQYDDRR